MAKNRAGRRCLLCVKNDDYPTSLEMRKIYRSLPDPAAKDRNFMRVIDESGEDYLYPADYFVTVELPKAAASLFAEVS